MTNPQVRYRELLETRRHNETQERTSAFSAAESARTNRENESIKRRANEISIYGIDKNAETGRYVADTNAAASRYSADRSYQASTYATDTNAATQREVAQLNASTNRYATDTNAAVSVYKTNTESANAQARLAFDRQTQVFKNTMESRRYNLEVQKTQLANALTKAQTESVRASTQKTLSDMRVAIEQLAIQAKQYGLAEEAAKYNNALTRAREAEAISRTAVNVTQAVNTALDITKGIIALVTN